MQGFAPAGEALLFRQKDPKPISPVRGPTGSSASAPNKMVAQLAALRQCSPKGSIRVCGSAAHEGGVKLALDILNCTKFSTKDLTICRQWRCASRVEVLRKVSDLREGLGGAEGPAAHDASAPPSRFWLEEVE